MMTTLAINAFYTSLTEFEFFLIKAELFSDEFSESVCESFPPAYFRLETAATIVHTYW